MPNEAEPTKDDKDIIVPKKYICSFCGKSVTHRGFICIFKYDTEDCEDYIESEN